MDRRDRRGRKHDDSQMLEAVLHTAPPPLGPDGKPLWVQSKKRYNGLSISQGRDDLEAMPNFRSVHYPYLTHLRNSLILAPCSAIAHDVAAMHGFDARQWGPHQSYPAGHTSWAIVTSAGVVSRIHFDTAGLGTALFVLTGHKYWVVANPLPKHRHDLDPRRVGVFKDWDDEFVDNRYSWEGVSLFPGDVL